MDVATGDAITSGLAGSAIDISRLSDLAEIGQIAQVIRIIIGTDDVETALEIAERYLERAIYKANIYGTISEEIRRLIVVRAPENMLLLIADKLGEMECYHGLREIAIIDYPVPFSIRNRVISILRKKGAAKELGEVACATDANMQIKLWALDNIGKMGETDVLDDILSTNQIRRKDSAIHEAAEKAFETAIEVCKAGLAEKENWWNKFRLTNAERMAGRRKRRLMAKNAISDAIASFESSGDKNRLRNLSSWSHGHGYMGKTAAAALKRLNAAERTAASLSAGEGFVTLPRWTMRTVRSAGLIATDYARGLLKRRH